eukprot:237716_1
MERKTISLEKHQKGTASVQLSPMLNYSLLLCKQARIWCLSPMLKNSFTTYIWLFACMYSVMYSLHLKGFNFFMTELIRYVLPSPHCEKICCHIVCIYDI